MRYASVVELRRNRLVAAWGGKRPGWIDEAIPEELDEQARGGRVQGQRDACREGAAGLAEA